MVNNALVPIYDSQGQAVRVIDRNSGRVLSINKSVYNLDPNFWQMKSGGTGYATREIEKKPYKWHSHVYACVRSITSNLANLPHTIVTNDEDEKTIKNHAIIKKLRRPNPWMSGNDLWEHIYLFLLLPTLWTPGGQCFLIGDMGNGKFCNFTKGELPWELYVYSDATIKAVKDRMTGLIQGWEFAIAGTKKHEFSLDEVIRIRFTNPYDLALGLSPYSAAQIATVQDMKADEFNTKLFDNDGRVAGLISSDQWVDQDQAEQITKRWNDNYAGAGNAGKVAILPLGLHYEQFMKTHSDMQFIEQKKLNKEAIMEVYGVPESELAIYTKGLNKATAEQADRNYWTKTLIPHDRMVWDSLNALWIENTENGKVKGKSDLSKVAALQEDLKLKVDTAKALFDMGVPTAEACRVAQISVETEKYPWLERAWVPVATTDIETALTPPEPVDPNVPPEKDPKKSEEEGEPPKKEDETEKSVAAIKKAIEEVKRMRYEKRRAYSLEYIAKVLDPNEKAFKKELTDKYFIRQRNLVLDTIDDWAKKNADSELDQAIKSVENLDDMVTEVGTPVIVSAKSFGYEYKDFLPTLSERTLKGWLGTVFTVKVHEVLKAKKVPITEFNIDVDDEFDEFVKIYKGYVKDQMLKEKNKVEADLKTTIEWDITADNIEEFVNSRDAYISGIQNVTFHKVHDQVSEVIMDAMDEGLSVKETAQNLKNAVSQVFENRRANAQTIARTEIASISNATRQDLFEAAGIEKHEWVTAGDDLVRESHMMEDGNIVDVGDRFPITGLTNPCENGGDPEEVINCRCIVVPIMEGDEE